LKKTIILYYDKQCLFCDNYVRLLKLKENFEIILKDARLHLTEIKQLCNNLDINDGFVVIYEKRCFQGSFALQFLNTAVDKTTFIGKLHFLFKYDNLFSKILYKLFFNMRKIIFFLFNKNPKI
jgi:predicted DCC family thiol-disulfide oxidoreductase YuxK